jgi:hypothetical protein
LRGCGERSISTLALLVCGQLRHHGALRRLEVAGFALGIIEQHNSREPGEMNPPTVIWCVVSDISGIRNLIQKSKIAGGESECEWRIKIGRHCLNWICDITIRNNGEGKYYPKSRRGHVPSITSTDVVDGSNLTLIMPNPVFDSAGVPCSSKKKVPAFPSIFKCQKQGPPT